MSIDEQDLTDRLHQLAVPVPAGLAQRACRLGRRRLLRRRSGAVIGVALVGTAVGSVALTAHHGGSVSQVVAADGPTATTPSSGPALTCAPGKPSIAPGVRDDPGLEAVCLPAPAPGFPIVQDRFPTTAVSGGYDHGELARTFLLDATQPRVIPSTSASAGDGTAPSVGVGQDQTLAPTGPQLSIAVARRGSWPTTPAAVSAAHVYPVTGTTTVRGVTGTVVRVDARTRGILIQLGDFDIQAYGANDAGGPTPTVNQINAVLETLRNLG